MNDREEKLAEEIAKIQELGKRDKNINTAMLLENLLARAHSASLSHREKTRAFLVSVLAPPFGLYYFAKFWGRTETDARTTAWMCLVLTVLSVILFTVFFGVV